jgi:phosphotransferase system  glucose/maltose/N-acetylglucosamine-specific IIC component
MTNRTAAVIITIVAVFLCGCPGLAALCWGLISLVDYAGGLGITGIGDQNGYLASIFGGICGGIILIAIVVVVAYFTLRKKKETLPTGTDQPLPPSSPDEPLPPAI